jgi:hypothetical protein
MSPPFTLYNVAQCPGYDCGRTTKFQVDYVPLRTLEQPMANNKCGFYVMWAMLQYLGGKMSYANELGCVCFPFYLYRLIQQNDLLFCLTFVPFNIIFVERQRKKFKHQRLLNMEIRRLEEELASFILTEILDRDRTFSIAKSKKFKA